MIFTMHYKSKNGCKKSNYMTGASKGATKGALLAPGAAYGFCGGQLINGIAGTIATVCCKF